MVGDSSCEALNDDSILQLGLFNRLIGVRKLSVGEGGLQHKRLSLWAGSAPQ